MNGQGESGVPDFGPLAGVKVVHSGQAVAGPFGAELLAELGAEVLGLENPLAPDLARRSGTGASFQVERRNQRTLALNIPTPAGREILLKLLAEADIFMEASKGGQFERWGLGDDVLWSANPRLVIVHTSGYGQEGDPSYVKRAAFDPIAQAFGCYMQLNGPPERPLPARPFTADYMTGVFAAFSALAALHRSRLTGEGDSVDLAMYEVVLRAAGGAAVDHLNGARPELRPDTRRVHIAAGCGLFRCQDGRDVYILVRGPGVLRRALGLVGLETPSDLFPAGRDFVPLDTPSGDLFDRTVTEYCAQRSAAAVDEAFNNSEIPCSMVYSFEAAEQHPHYRARESFGEWTKANGESIRGVNVVPKLTRRPGRIWRGSPVVGQDTIEVLHELGFDDEDVDRLCAANIVAKPDPH